MLQLENKTQGELVAEIHESFYSADERVLEEAKSLLANPNIKKAQFAERLSKVGFAASKPVTEAIEMAEAHLQASGTISAIEYFRVYYPNNKFITAAEVKKLCEKYGLLLGDAANYIGDVPEKNLVDIEKFSLRKEDWTEKPATFSLGMLDMSAFTRWFTPNYDGIGSVKSRRTGVLSDYFRRVNSEIGGIPRGFLPLFEQPEEKLSDKISYAYGEKKEEPAKDTEQAALKICAPKQDFNTAGFEVRDGHVLVWDPVVLQPVKDGNFLIVTAWGPEGSDELVVNQAQN